MHEHTRWRHRRGWCMWLDVCVDEFPLELSFLLIRLEARVTVLYGTCICAEGYVMRSRLGVVPGFRSEDCVAPRRQPVYAHVQLRVLHTVSEMNGIGALYHISTQLLLFF